MGGEGLTPHSIAIIKTCGNASQLANSGLGLPTELFVRLGMPFIDLAIAFSSTAPRSTRWINMLGAHRVGMLSKSSCLGLLPVDIDTYNSEYS